MGMTTTTREPGDGTVAGERAWGVVSDEQGGFADDRSDCTDEIAWGTCLSEGDEGYWTRDLEEDWVTGAAPVDTPHTIPNTGAGSDLLSQLKTVRGVLAGVAARLPEVGSAELTQVAAQASAVVAAAEAARAAVVLDADARGVIASSDNPRVDRFVEQACRDAGIPVTTRHAATLKDVASACEGHDVSAVREAVVSGHHWSPRPWQRASSGASAPRSVR